MKSLEKRLARERDELERDRQTLASRKAEESLGLVESLFSVLLGSKSLRSASRRPLRRSRPPPENGGCGRPPKDR